MAQDPRAEALKEIYEMRTKLNVLEEVISSIPHAEETYDVPFVGAQPGDYMHPKTPTHTVPEQFTILGDDSATWDSAYQCWIQGTPSEEDTYNILGNLNPNMSFDSETETWSESGEDWSNNYEPPIHEGHPLRAIQAYEEGLTEDQE